MRILVTGASGFIGRQTLGFLRDGGYEVHTLGRRPPPYVQGVVHHNCDLLEPHATRETVRAVRAPYLLHLAWYVEPGKFWTSHRNLEWVAASLRLFLDFVECGGRRMVGAGTCAEYDWAGSGPLKETQTPLCPSTLYGASKLAFATLIKAAIRGTDVTIAWGRVFMLYGPHEQSGRLVPDVVNALLEGREAHCTNGRQVRDFMHVRDVGRAFVELLKSDVNGPVNIASGIALSVADVVQRVGELVGRPDLLRLGSLPSQPDAQPSLMADVALLRNKVGFTPRFTLDEGLTNTISWWRAVRLGSSAAVE